MMPVRARDISLIIGMGLLVYANTFFSSFHFDDTAYIVGNPAVRDIHHWAAIWNFCPSRSLTFLSFALNYHFGVLNVFGYHLFNTAIHLGSALLVWQLLRLTLMTPSMKAEPVAAHADTLALLAGLLFVAHPVQTEAVTYIYQRAASMAAFFYLASLCAYARARLLTCAGQRATGFYVLAFLAATAAMFTKENAITLPLMALMYEFTFFNAAGTADRRRVVPLLLTILIIPLTLMLTGSHRFEEIHRVMDDSRRLSPLHYLLTQLRVMVTYIRLLFFPVRQNLDYDYPVFTSILEGSVLASLLSLAAVLYAAWRLFPRYRLISFSIYWFFLTLLPESSILPIWDVINEYRLYLPMAGFSIFLVSGFYYLGRDHFRMTARLLMLIIACYAVLAYQRNEVWKDEISLWRDVIRKAPHKSRAYVDLALALCDQGQTAQALAAYDQAIAADPYDAYAYYNRGLEYYRQDRLMPALADLNKAIEINPGYAPSYTNRGLVRHAQGQLGQAIADYTRAISLNPVYGPAYNDRAVAYYALGQYALAWKDVRAAQAEGFMVNPGFIRALEARYRSFT